MGFMDKVKGMLGQHSDKAGKGVDKTTETLDKRTGGKHSDKIQTGSDKTKESMDRYSQNERRNEGGGGSGSGGQAA